MPYTFGGATGDDAWLAGGSTQGATASNGLVMGWWYPTTLTAGRTYWGVGTVAGTPPKLVVGTTTSELEASTDNATTDGLWTTTGAGITTNKWWFIAAAGSFTDTGPAGQFLIWVGDEATPPQAISVANTTAPAGNHTGLSRRVWGNIGSSGTSAFQGDIGAGMWINFQSSNVGAGTTVRTAGSISTIEGENMLSRLIWPFWAGRFDPMMVTPSANANMDIICWDTLADRGYVYSNNLTSDVTVSVTISGATQAANNRPSRRYLPDFALRRPSLRRVA